MQGGGSRGVRISKQRRGGEYGRGYRWVRGFVVVEVGTVTAWRIDQAKLKSRSLFLLPLRHTRSCASAVIPQGSDRRRGRTLSEEYCSPFRCAVAQARIGRKKAGVSTARAQRTTRANGSMREAEGARVQHDFDLVPNGARSKAYGASGTICFPRPHI